MAVMMPSRPNAVQNQDPGVRVGALGGIGDQHVQVRDRPAQRLVEDLFEVAPQPRLLEVRARRASQTDEEPLGPGPHHATAVTFNDAEQRDTRMRLSDSSNTASPTSSRLARASIVRLTSPASPS